MVPRLNNSQTVGPSALQASRAVALHAIEDLANRLALVSVFLRAQQHVDVARVNRQVSLALPAVLIVLMFLPDIGFVAAVTYGSPAKGYLPPCGLWAPKQVSYQSLSDA